MSMHGLRIHPLSNSVLPNHVPEAPPTRHCISPLTPISGLGVCTDELNQMCLDTGALLKKLHNFQFMKPFESQIIQNKAIFLKLPVHKSPCHKLLKMLSQLVKHSCLEFHIVEILKGSYDVISSFSFSLECYKLIVDR